MQFNLDALKAKPGKADKDLSHECLIRFGQARAKEDADPVALSTDFGHLKPVLTYAPAVHGVGAKIEPVDLARVALKRPPAWSAIPASETVVPAARKSSGCFAIPTEVELY